MAVNNSFAFVDACLEGDAARASRVLISLEGEKLEPILLLGALSRETRKLVILSDAKATGNPAVIDALHDVLADQFHEELLNRQQIEPAV